MKKVWTPCLLILLAALFMGGCEKPRISAADEEGRIDRTVLKRYKEKVERLQEHQEDDYKLLGDHLPMWRIDVWLLGKLANAEVEEQVRAMENLMYNDKVMLEDVLSGYGKLLELRISFLENYRDFLKNNND